MAHEPGATWSRTDLGIDLLDTKKGTWSGYFREVPVGVYAQIRERSMVLTPEQADALEEFLADARRIREAIGTVSE